MCSGYESTGIVNSGITPIGLQAIGEGWVNTLADEELGDGKGGIEEITGTGVIWCCFEAGASVNSVALISFSVAGEGPIQAQGASLGEGLED